jgi:hypothetical protein
MNRDQLLEWVTRLGREFVRRGMPEHARLLRLYYLAVERGLDSKRHEVQLHWNSTLVVDWMKNLQLAPWQVALRVRAEGSSCQSCRRVAGATPTVRTEATFPGGARMRCGTCGDAWLVHHRG